MTRTKLPCLAVFLAVPALAQTDGTYLLMSSNTVSPSSPITTIEVWATWVDPAAQFIFLGGNYDLTAGDGVFSNPVIVLRSPFSSAGVIAGNVISGAAIAQLNMCFFLSCPLTDNPILLATYDWTTTDFTPRAVDLHTSNTSVFDVGIPLATVFIQLYPHEFSPGSGVINVVPAPAAWVVLALPLVAGTRRRRS